jgi:hypothetical protein
MASDAERVYGLLVQVGFHGSCCARTPATSSSGVPSRRYIRRRSPQRRSAYFCRS